MPMHPTIFGTGTRYLVIGRPLAKSQMKAAMKFVPIEVGKDDVVLEIPRHEMKSFLLNYLGPEILGRIADLVFDEE